MARVAIMFKGDATGVIAEAFTVPVVAVNDSRNPQHKMIHYHSPMHARAGFEDVLRISRENGWRIGYMGERHAE